MKSRRSARKVQLELAKAPEQGDYEIPKPMGQDMPNDPDGTRTVTAVTHV